MEFGNYPCIPAVDGLHRFFKIYRTLSVIIRLISAIRVLFPFSLSSYKNCLVQETT